MSIPEVRRSYWQIEQIQPSSAAVYDFKGYPNCFCLHIVQSLNPMKQYTVIELNNSYRTDFILFRNKETQSNCWTGVSIVSFVVRGEGIFCMVIKCTLLADMRKVTKTQRCCR